MILIRHCKYLLVVVYKLLSCMQYALPVLQLSQTLESHAAEVLVAIVVVVVVVVIIIVAAIVNTY